MHIEHIKMSEVHPTWKDTQHRRIQGSPARHPHAGMLCTASGTMQQSKRMERKEATDARPYLQDKWSWHDN
jgi:hypothetical protein